MIALDGQNALSAFRLERLNRQLAEIFPGARVTVARYVYLLQGAVPLDQAGHQRLAQVLEAGTAPASAAWVK